MRLLRSYLNVQEDIVWSTQEPNICLEIPIVVWLAYLVVMNCTWYMCSVLKSNSHAQYKLLPLFDGSIHMVLYWMFAFSHSWFTAWVLCAWYHIHQLFKAIMWCDLHGPSPLLCIILVVEPNLQEKLSPKAATTVLSKLRLSNGNDNGEVPNLETTVCHRPWRPLSPCLVHQVFNKRIPVLEIWAIEPFEIQTDSQPVHAPAMASHSNPAHNKLHLLSNVFFFLALGPRQLLGLSSACWKVGRIPHGAPLNKTVDDMDVSNCL